MTGCSLTLFQMENAGKASVLYCIQPKHWLVEGYLRRKLGFLPSKSTKEIPQFEVGHTRDGVEHTALFDISSQELLLLYYICGQVKQFYLSF